MSMTAVAGRLGVVAALALTAGSASAAVHCVNKTGAAGCATKIQDAISAAAAGDAIVVAPGVYTESGGIIVPVGKDALRISGPPTAILDPTAGVAGSDAPILVIAANGVTVTGLTFRNGGSDGIYVGGAGFTLAASKITGPRGIGLVFGPGADGGTVRSSTIERCVQGIAVSAGGLTITSNTIASTRKAAIAGVGAALAATGNRIASTHGGINVVSAGAVVQRNTLTAIGGAAVQIGGADANVSSNVMTAVKGFGVAVIGDRAVVASNAISYGGDADFSALSVEGNDATITRNTILDSPGDGIEVTGNNANLGFNKVVPLSTSDGVVVHGNLASVSHNSVSGGWRGILLFGDAPRVTSNTVADAFQSGLAIHCETFPVDASSHCTGGTVSLNTVTRVAHGGGIDVYATRETAAIDVLGNSVTGAHWSCFFFGNGEPDPSPVGMTVRGNRAATCGAAQGHYGFEFLGAGYTAEMNSASSTSGDGFLIYADASTFRSNTSLFARGHGFEVEGGAGVALSGNHAVSFNASGFAVRPGVTGITATGNTVSAPGIVGLCDASGTAVPSVGNSFGSTATPADCTRAYGYY
jgi:hypothetical protein